MVTVVPCSVVIVVSYEVIVDVCVCCVVSNTITVWYGCGDVGADVVIAGVDYDVSGVVVAVVGVGVGGY